MTRDETPKTKDERPIVSLREVIEPDIERFYEYQLDPEACAMAQFPAREREAHVAHWVRILADETTVNRTILCDGQVAGNIGSWEDDGTRLVGYWLGRAFWGRGIATRALAAMLKLVPERPLVAVAAKGNIGSIRVLQKNGFAIIAEDDEEVTMELKS
jgi:RimJ/RimL family protein N-acetyltransferase